VNKKKPSPWASEVKKKISLWGEVRKLFKNLHLESEVKKKIRKTSPWASEVKKNFHIIYKNFTLGK